MSILEASVFLFAANGETIGLIVVALWDDVATAEGQDPRVRGRVGFSRPEEAVRTESDSITRGVIDVASIPKREWELYVR